MASAKSEDYLKAVYHLREGDQPVAPSAIADALGVSPPTVTATMKRLADHGLIEREEYKGVRLTGEGELIAIETVRHHRLLELFLAEHLEYDWSEVHDEADRLEHHISERLETELAAALGDPAADPHGAPIPTEGLEPTATEDQPLSAYDEGETVAVSQVADDDPEVLAYLSTAGITPGTRLVVVEVAPFGMVTVVPKTGHDDGRDTDTGRNTDADATRETVSLPEEIAAAIRVREPDKECSEDEPVVVG